MKRLEFKNLLCRKKFEIKNSTNQSRFCEIESIARNIRKRMVTMLGRNCFVETSLKNLTNQPFYNDHEKVIENSQS